MAQEYTIEEIKKLGRIRANEVTLIITANDPNPTISVGTNIRNITLYLKGEEYKSGEYTYQKDGRDLKIKTIESSNSNEETNKSQEITLKNYFKSASSYSTSSVIKSIKYDKDAKTTNTVALFDLIQSTDLNPSIAFDINKKGVVSGTQFSDVIQVVKTEEDIKKVFKNFGKKDKGLTINAGSGSDTISGTKYNDIISGGAGENVINFDFASGFGKDVVKLTKGENLTLNFKNGDTTLSYSALTYEKIGNNLVITKSGDDKNQVTVQNYFKNTAVVSIGNDVIKTELEGGNIILNMTGKGKFSGTNYNDNIIGNDKKADTILTGVGTDRVNALGGNDTIKLGAGDKTVEIGYADGNDTITLTNSETLKTTGLNLIYDTGVAANLVYAIAKNNKDLYIYRDNDQYTLIKNYFVTQEGSDDLIPATTLTINGVAAPEFDSYALNLSKNNKITIDDNDAKAYKSGEYILGNKNDTVTINSGDNDINLLKGNDTVFVGVDYAGTTDIKTAGGSDTIKVMGYEKDDIDVNRVSNDIVIKADDENTFKLTVDEYQDKNATLTVKDMNNKVVNVVKSGTGKINGTNNNDILIGNSNNNTITGGKGDDIIYTRGGQDTVVLTGKYGHDIISAEKISADDRVTLKMNSFNYNNIAKTDNDFVYITDENSGFIYSDFFKSEADVADLWVKVGRTNTHIVNAKEDYNNTDNTDTNLVYLTADKIEYKGAESDKLNIAVSRGDESTFSYQDGFEKYVDEGKTNTTYNATISSKTLLELDDLGGYDTLNLGNVAIDVKEASNDNASNPSGLRLFFNVDVNTDSEGYAKGYADEGYLLYDSESLDYNHIMSVTRGDTSGAISIIENDIDETGVPTGEQYGKIEHIVTKDGYVLDMDGWKAYVSDKVSQWLKDNDKTSVAQVLSLKQTKANKALVADLVKVYTDASYESYIDNLVGDDDFSTLKNQNYSDLVFVKSGDDLVVKGITSSGEFGELFKKEGYFKKPSEITFVAKGDKSQYSVGSEDVPIIINTEDNVQMSNVISSLKFTDEYTKTHLTVTDGENATLIFTDKEYKDFYTKDDSSGNYTAGDPLIYKGSFAEGKTAEPDEWKKGGNNLAIGDVQIDNIDGKSGNIVIQDKDGLTKTIVVGKETIDGTFESEIIVGSNSADTINALGGDDLIYSGDGDDTLNFVKPTAGESTGNNTAPMVVIGGSDYLPANHKVSAISVYDTAGNDTYNTSFDVGLYIEDKQGADTDIDTINITGNQKTIFGQEKPLTTSDMRFIFDVINPKYLDPTVSGKPTFYADLFIISQSGYMQMAMGLASSMSKYSSTADIMSSLQGSFGYVWVDDQYSTSQEIENINVNGAALDVDIDRTKLNHESTDSYIQTMYQAVSAWLTAKDYGSAWSVIENDKSSGKADTIELFMMYSKTQSQLETYLNGLNS